jgi:UDP-N-acetylmuramoyl-L-alanyl-D-glutamate--2,6-diaminopimelate ligase
MKKQFRQIRALLYKTLYANPSKEMHIIGVTGTEGKSTTCEIIYQILRASGKSTGMISTIGMKINDIEGVTGLHSTTPSSKEIYDALHQMKQHKVEYVVLELSSQGLAQYRAHGIRLAGCVYTNIHQDHFDYHKTFENYREAKASMMEMLVPGGKVVINHDDANWDFLTSYAKNLHKDLGIQFYSMRPQSKKKQNTVYIAQNISKTAEGYRFGIKLSNLSIPITSHLQGTYNIQNTLAAVSITTTMGLPLAGIIQGVEKVRNVKGRMNVIQTKPFMVVVDFAHTAIAILRLLEYLRSENTSGRIISLFGAPGRRDASKRPDMGKNAASFSDVLILTEDDTRDEPFENIIREIREGIDEKRFIEGKNLFIIKSREEAIKYALTTLAKPGDTVVLIGKGHEESLAIGKEEIPWNEEKIALQYLKQHKS